MPTISEPIWREKQERVEQAIKDFIEAERHSVDDSEDVLRARLFGFGLRGEDLHLEVHRACLAKLERRPKCPKTREPCPYYGTCMQCLQRKPA
jgi:hypothetical protein